MEPWVGHGVPLDWPRREVLQPPRVSHPPSLAWLWSAWCQWVPFGSEQPWLPRLLWWRSGRWCRDGQQWRLMGRVRRLQRPWGRRLRMQKLRAERWL